MSVSPGGAASVVNEFRKEMGLPIRINYTYEGNKRHAVFFGNNTLSPQNARAIARSYKRKLDKYTYKSQGSVKNIPMVITPKR